VADVDAIFFTAEEQARPWRSAGILTSRHAIHAVPEASRRVRRVAREEARRRSGVHGEPALLWVGRLVPTKDPLTVLEGFARVLPRLPQARLTYVYQDAALVEELRARLEAQAELRARVRLAGKLDRTALADCLSAADIFVLGSHAEGSGYALIEALACGLVPVVTDIPSFRALTDRGRLGALWPPGDAGALAEAVVGVAERSMEERRAAILRYFEAELSWPAVGRRALEAYRSARETRRA
jgi:glycosyltransferase involved in cell wall biosynthesis